MVDEIGEHMNSLIIWAWHRILPEGGKGTVTPKVFAAQLAFLRQQGYVFIDTAELSEVLRHGIPSDRRLAMLTFDDGWADNLIWATPILQQFGAKAVMAVNTALVNPERKMPLDAEHYPRIPFKIALEKGVYGHSLDSFLTWNELAELQRSGIWDLQAHGNSHFGCYQTMWPVRGFYPDCNHWTMEYALDQPPFPGAPRCEFVSTLAAPRTRPQATFLHRMRQAGSNGERRRICRRTSGALDCLENEDQFVARIHADLEACRKQFEEHLGIIPRSLFWPWGHHSEVGRRVALDCGFELLLTMNKDVVRFGSNPTMLPRIAAPLTAHGLQREHFVFSHPVLKTVRDWWARRST